MNDLVLPPPPPHPTTGPENAPQTPLQPTPPPEIKKNYSSLPPPSTTSISPASEQKYDSGGDSTEAAVTLSIYMYILLGALLLGAIVFFLLNRHKE